MSVLQGLRRACQINPQGVATVDGDRRQTWLQFRDRVARFAGALQAAGVGRGDRVAILSLNRAAYLEYFYAAPWAGVTVVPLNTRLAAPELVAIINDSGVGWPSGRRRLRRDAAGTDPGAHHGAIDLGGRGRAPCRPMRLLWMPPSKRPRRWRVPNRRATIFTGSSTPAGRPRRPKA